MSGDEINEILGVTDLQTLRRDNPQRLFRHLDVVRQAFLFGVEDHTDAEVEGEEEEEGRWGGDFRVVINRNLVVHLLPGFREGTPSRAELPQLVVMPDADRADDAEGFEATLDGDETTRGVIFWVDPFDYDVLAREAQRIAAQYPGWDMIPDSYFLDTDLVRFISRTILEHPVVRAEQEYDFRLGMAGGTEAPPLDDEEMYTAEDLISPDTGEEDEEGEEVERERDDDEDEPPLEGMRSHPVEWG